MNPYIFQGAMRGFQDATQTLLSVSLKKQQLERETKSFDIGMKMKKLQLEGLQEKMSPEQLEYNKTLQGLEIKSHKLKTEKATLELNKLRTEAELSQSVLNSYLKGAEQGEVDGVRQGLDIGGVEYIPEVPIPGFKRVTPTQRLSREKATEELKRRAEAKEAGVPFKERKEPLPKITGMIRKLKAANAPREDIEEAIKFEGYEVEDYSAELEEYQSFRGRGAAGRF